MQLTSVLRTSRLTNIEVIRSYRKVLTPSISYPLGAIYFTPDQCTTLQNLAGQDYLPKLGFNRKIPKDIFYGPSKLGGWGERDLFIHMETLQTNLLLGHIRDGKLLVSDLDYTQILSGMKHSILHQKTPSHFIKRTEHTWMTDYKRILQETKGGVKISNQWLPSRQSKHNKFSMPIFHQFIQNQPSLKQLNNWRLYLQIFALSDLTYTEGTKLLKNPLNGVWSAHFISTFNWPNQKRPHRDASYFL